MHKQVQLGLASSLLSLVTVVSLPDVARADIVLKFSPLPAFCAFNSDGWDVNGSPYTESGFQIAVPAPAQTVSWCAASPNFAGPALWINIFGAAGATLRAVDNSPFSIASIDLANLFASAGGNGPLTFTAHVAGGGTLTQTFAFGMLGTAPPVFSTFSFGAAFTNLVSLDLPSQGNASNTIPSYQLTNVRLNASTVTPEPATWLLVATGLVGVAGFAKRRGRRD